MMWIPYSKMKPLNQPHTVFDQSARKEHRLAEFCPPISITCLIRLLVDSKSGSLFVRQKIKCLIVQLISIDRLTPISSMNLSRGV